MNRWRVVEVVAWLWLFGTACSGELAADLPTERFRENHQGIVNQIELIEAKLARLEEMGPAEKAQQVQEIVSFFEQRIRPLAEDEEAFFYSAVDRQGNGGQRPLTATMRYEHSLIDTWIELLAREVEGESLDIDRFIRRTYNLTGVLKAHLEKEEQVFLPILDKTMTQEEFEEQVLSRMEAHKVDDSAS